MAQPQKRHLVHVFPSFGSGGVPIRIANVLNGIGRAMRHTIVALDGDMASADRLDPALDAVVLDPRIDKGRPLAALWQIRGHLARLAPDLLCTYNWGAIEWALVNRLSGRRRHIHFESGFGPEEADRQIPRRVLLRRVALAGTDRIVVPSQTLVRIAEDVWRIPPSRLRYVPNGVDLARFACAAEPGIVPSFAKRPDELIVGTVAPVRPEKNLGRLVRAFAALAGRFRARLLIVGDGPERAGLEALAGELGLAERVVFAGYVKTPEKVLPWFDVFAISSDTEQMPNALIQAMAARRAVAGVDVGDVAHIVAPENRPFIAPKGSEAGLSEAIAGLLSDEALRTGLGAANEAHVRAHYAQEKMFAAYAEMFAP